MKNMIVVIGVLIFSGCTMVSSLSTEKKISSPMNYSGYTQETYDDFRRTSEYVQLDDGTRIAVDIYLPTGGPPREAFPTLFEFTVYGRAWLHPDLSWWKKSMIRLFMTMDGSVILHPLHFNQRYLENGYALVIADVRGSGASFGSIIPSMQKIGDDGAQLVKWIKNQSWCDGNIGMFGKSYLGITQIMTASHRPDGLKAICPRVAPASGYSDVYPGGIYTQGFVNSYSDWLNDLNLNCVNMNYRIQGKRFPTLPAAPVVDEDGDGELADEIPLDLNNNGNFLDDYSYPANVNDPPKYSDGNARNHLYYLATYEHQFNFRPVETTEQCRYIDTGISDTGSNLDDRQKGIRLAGYDRETIQQMTYYDNAAIANLKEVMDSGIGVLTIGEIMGAYSRSHTLLYSTLKETNSARLIMGPGYHMGDGPFLEYSGEALDDMRAKMHTEKLRFFDYYLKGIKNNYEKDPSVMIYVPGKGWQFKNEWPFHDQKQTTFYFSEDHSLLKEKNGNGRDIYLADYDHDSRYGDYQSSRFHALVSPDELPVRTDKDMQCLTYTTPVLMEDMDVIGHPVVNLWVSSTADYGDFYVYLMDVDEEGESLLISEGALRAGFATLHDNDMLIRKGQTNVDVLPDLPWHGFEKTHYIDRILKDEAILQLQYDLYPTAWVFRKGHRIRVSIACSDWPTFRLHPKLSPANNPHAPDTIIPEITVYRNATHASNIVLPVVPSR